MRWVPNSKEQLQKMRRAFLAPGVVKTLDLHQRNAIERQKRMARERISREMSQLKNILFTKEQELNRLVHTRRKLQEDSSYISSNIGKEQLDVDKLDNEIKKHQKKIDDLKGEIHKEEGIITQLKAYLMREKREADKVRGSIAGTKTHARGVEGSISVLSQEIKEFNYNCRTYKEDLTQ